VTQLQDETATLRNSNRVGQSFGHIREQRRHFLRSSQMLLLRVASLPA